MVPHVRTFQSRPSPKRNFQDGFRVEKITPTIPFESDTMKARHLLTTLIVVALCASAAWAQSAGYHLERLHIQSQAFLNVFGPAVAPPSDTGVSLDERLHQATKHSVWAHQMVLDDVDKVVEASREWSSKLTNATPDELQTARTTLETLSRRLKVSTSAVELTPQARTALDFLFLELEESAKTLDLQRAQLLAREVSRRRSRVHIGVGLGYYGYGPYGPWGHPWGVGRYYPYGYGFGPGPFYPGYPW